MQFLRLDEVPSDPADRVFRHSPARAVIAAAAAAIAAGVLAALGWSRDAWPAYVSAAMLVLGLVVMQRFVTARFRPSNWLARLSERGVYVQLRSYLNHHFPAQGRTVVFIPFAEIRSARRVREVHTVSHYDGAESATRSSQRRRYVELELAAEDARLAQALGAERARHDRRATSHRYAHHPVALADPRRLRIDWSGVGGEREFLEAIGRHAAIEADEQAAKDFTQLERLRSGPRA